jgi:hypothetical protein
MQHATRTRRLPCGRHHPVLCVRVAAADHVTHGSTRALRRPCIARGALEDRDEVVGQRAHALVHPLRPPALLRGVLGPVPWP